MIFFQFVENDFLQCAEQMRHHTAQKFGLGVLTLQQHFNST